MLLALLTENRTLVLNLFIAFTVLSVLIFRAARGFDLVKKKNCYPSYIIPSDGPLI